MYTKYEQWLNEAKSENFKTKEEVQSWLDKMRIKNYTINDDLTVDVTGNVKISWNHLTRIPVQFGIVSGYFDCGHNDLKSLQGCPKEVGGDYSCAYNKLTTLEGGPKEVKGNIWCNNNKAKFTEEDVKSVSKVKGIIYA